MAFFCAIFKYLDVYKTTVPCLDVCPGLDACRITGGIGVIKIKAQKELSQRGVYPFI